MTDADTVRVELIDAQGQLVPDSGRDVRSGITPAEALIELGRILREEDAQNIAIFAARRLPDGRLDPMDIYSRMNQKNETYFIFLK
jgi:hypothetical protein